MAVVQEGGGGRISAVAVVIAVVIVVSVGAAFFVVGRVVVAFLSFGCNITAASTTATAVALIVLTSRLS